ncbi:hypothetical protein CRYO30217_00949 [Parvicella tangerina]|uniref:histidine kinase n=1 Tax=Parvicella tangerina TaxID=2829795 RepID=A0A916JLR5_9FLAO|nr:hypothetical protein CRYO30217_00949 [Parvicella tangerina]
MCFSQTRDEIEALCSLGYNDIIGDLEGKRDQYEEALAAAKEFGMDDEVALILERLALISHYLHDFEKALKYSFEAVDYYESKGDLKKLANLYTDLGFSIKHIQLDRSIEYFRAALKINQLQNMGADQAKYFNNYGTLMGMSGKLDSALYYHLKSLEVCIAYKDSLAMPYSLNNAAVIYSKMGSYKKAFEFMDQSDAIRKLEDNDLSWADNLAYRADIFYEMEAYDSAAVYYEQALELSQTSKFVNLITFSLERLSYCYEKLNDAEQAMKYYKLLNEHKDSLLSAETNAAIASLQEEFNAAEKQKKIAEQSLELTKQDLKIERQEKRELYIIFSVLALILFGGWVIYFQVRKRKTERLKLEHAKAMEKAELEKQFVEEKLRIGRELHDSIGAQLTFMISSVDNLSYLEKEEKVLLRLNKISDFGRNTMKELRTTIWAMKNDDGTLNDLVLKINELKISVQEVIDLKVSVRLSLDHRLNALELLNLYRIVQEFVQNTVKYAEASFVSIAFDLIDDKINMVLKDDGKGFDVAANQYAGNGLANMQQRCESIKGKFQLSSGAAGTELVCTLSGSGENT